MNALLLLVVVNATILVLGGAITHLTLRASRRTGSLARRRLAVGFGIVTAEAVGGGAVHRGELVDRTADVLRPEFGDGRRFAVIAHSLYAETPERERGRRVA